MELAAVHLCIFVVWDICAVVPSMAEDAPSKSLLSNLEGEVASQEFVYYKIMHPGHLLLTLESFEGDADIYVSEKTPSPSYHPDSYDFQSATCGVDSVTIPKNMKRPVAVGIYGWSRSKFALEVYQITESDDIDYFYEAEVANEVNTDGANDRRDKKKPVTKAKKNLRNLPNGLWWFLEVFEMTFL